MFFLDGLVSLELTWDNVFVCFKKFELRVLTI